MSTGIALLLVLPVALWLIFAVANGGSIRHWDLDVNGVAMTFLGLYDRYCQAYRWLMVLALAGAVWKRGGLPPALAGCRRAHVKRREEERRRDRRRQD